MLARLRLLVVLPLLWIGVSATVPKVAFSVAKSSNQVMDGSAIITFDREFTNVGNTFDMRTNTFTCPHDGIYVFHLHGLSGDMHRRFLAGIYHNNNLIVTAYTKVREFWSTGSNTVVLNMQAGDTVQVKFVYGQNDLYGDEAELYTTFSGYLIA